MTTKLKEPSPEEEAAARQIRQAIEAFVASKDLGDSEMGVLLGLVPEGVQNLRGKSWGLEKAWRIASALRIKIVLQISADTSR
jgi:hypothetical protein